MPGLRAVSRLALAASLWGCPRAAPLPPPVADLPLAPVPAGPPWAWELAFEYDMGEEVLLVEEGGHPWALVAPSGPVEALVALDADAKPLWRHKLLGWAYFRASDDGSTVVVADMVGCIHPVNARTGERGHTHLYTVDPFAWDISADGQVAWSWGGTGNLVFRRFGDGTFDPGVAVGPDEAGGEIEVHGDVLYVEADTVLAARRLPTGELLGQRPWRDARICKLETDRVWVSAADGAGDATPLHPETLVPLGDPDPDGCRGPRLDFEHYGLVLHHPGGLTTPFGYGHDDALARDDGSVWIVDDSVLSGWTPSPRPVRAHVLAADDGFPVEVEYGDWYKGEVTFLATETTPELRFPVAERVSAWRWGNVVVTENDGDLRALQLPGLQVIDRLRVSPPRRDGPATTYEAMLQADGSWRLVVDVDGKTIFLEVGPR